jgi:hypothetical protein
VKDRRKVLYWIAGALSAMTVFKFFQRKEKAQPKMVKMLTEDGQLVEVDMNYLTGAKTKIKPDEIHTWVKRKK